MLSILHSRTLTKRRGAERGFTLIELLVVIVIIGILAAIAIPAFLNQRQTARDASVTSDVRNAATEIQTVFTKYPDATYFAVKSGKSTDNTGAKTASIPAVDENYVEGENGVVTFFIGNSSTDYTTVTANLSNGVRITVRCASVTPGSATKKPGYFVISAYNPSGKAFDGVLDNGTRRAEVWHSDRGGLNK